MGEFEDYFAKEWFKPGFVPEFFPANFNCYDVKVDDLKFKLFHLSVLWRASAAELPDFAGINLGPHSETIRKMLFANDPGLQPCIHSQQLSCCHPETRRIISDLLAIHAPYRENGMRTYAGIFSGAIWRHVVSSHQVDLRDRLLENGELSIRAIRLDQLPGILELEERRNLFSAVCFTETPIAETHSLLEIAYRQTDLQPYGLVFLKDRMKARGFLR